MAGMVPPEKLEQIRAASDVVDVIGGYIPLKRAGANFVALCPFHKEKSPSFNVSPHKQSFHCFGCHKGGDVFKFVMEYENLPFIDAVRRLAERAKIPLEFENNPGQQQTRHLKDSLLQIHEQLTQRWQGALANDAAGQIARDYLAKRGVSEEAVKLFRLGYAPDKWDDTVNWAKSKHFELPIVAQGGLILQKEGSDSYYDRFRGRLMFPICDEQGRVIGFSGRVLSGDEKTAKYVNSPETLIFTKGKVLFALDKAKRAILEADHVVVCEGQLDTISCHSRGFPNVVAPQGTALTAEHIRILQRYTKDIILCFDGDNAGRKAAVRGFDELIKLRVDFRVAELPSPEDPDSFLKKYGKQAFSDLMVKSRDFNEWYLHYLSQIHDPQSDLGRGAIIQAMADVLRNRDNLVTSDVYAQKTAKLLGVTIASVNVEFKKNSGNKTNPSPRERAEETDLANAAAPSRPPVLELQLLRLILRHDELIDQLAARSKPEWLVNPGTQKIVSLRLAAHADQTWRDAATLLGNLENDWLRNLASEALTDKRPLPDPEKQIGDILLRLRNEYIDRQIAEFTQRMNEPNLPDEEKMELLHHQQALRIQRRQPLG